MVTGSTTPREDEPDSSRFGFTSWLSLGLYFTVMIAHPHLEQFRSVMRRTLHEIMDVIPTLSAANPASPQLAELVETRLDDLTVENATVVAKIEGCSVEQWLERSAGNIRRDLGQLQQWLVLEPAGARVVREQALRAVQSLHDGFDVRRGGGNADELLRMADEHCRRAAAMLGSQEELDSATHADLSEEIRKAQEALWEWDENNKAAG